MLASIKLLRKRRDRFRRPGGSIRRSVNAHIERFLFNDARDIERREEYPIRGPADIHRNPVAFGVDDSLFRNQKGINHDGRIVAKEPGTGLETLLATVHKLPEQFAHCFRLLPGGEMSSLGHNRQSTAGDVLPH